MSFIIIIVGTLGISEGTVRHSGLLIRLYYCGSVAVPVEIGMA